VSVLAIRAVDAWFPGGPQVLHEIELTVEAGEHWALLGANGAGKSTLLALAGAQRFPSRGTVDVLGRRLGRVDVRDLRRDIGTVDVRQRLPGELSLQSYVATGATQTVQQLGEPDAATQLRVAELIEKFSLAALADRAIGVCSQGEQARARLARALVPRPSLLLLDEPAAGLDLPGRADLLGAVEAAARDDTDLASVTVAHHLEELPAVTSHVALLREGRVMARGDVSLLADGRALSECFGRTVRSLDVGGRWFATALPA
jgi:iron complex transport system ATP-binding protein